MQRNYCYICGEKLRPETASSGWCEQCQQIYYVNPRPCATLALFDESGNILLAERGREPMKGKFGLPGGFIDLHETAEEAISREMKEELGLEPGQYSQPLYVTNYFHDYPYGKDMYKVLVFVFTAELKQGTPINPQDDVSGVKYVNLKDINVKEMSRPGLPDIIARASKVISESKPNNS